MAEAKSNTGVMPSEDLLLDYASGALPETVAVLVATMLALRPDLRQAVAGMEAIGGYILDEINPVSLSSDAFDDVLARIDAADMPDEISANNDNVEPFDAATIAIVPEPLRSRLGKPLSKLAWHKRGPGIEEYRLPVTDDRFKIAVLRLSADRHVPSHSHQGSELTLVLDGAFTDDTGRYARGDLAEKGEEEHHAPVADPQDGCLCLVITGGPLRFSNPLVQLFDRITRA